MPNGILIFTNDGKTLYHAGDTTVFAEMEWIGDEGIDLAMLPIGDHYTMGPAKSLRAIGLLRPKSSSRCTITRSMPSLRTRQPGRGASPTRPAPARRARSGGTYSL